MDFSEIERLAKVYTPIFKRFDKKYAPLGKQWKKDSLAWRAKTKGMSEREIIAFRKKNPFPRIPVWNPAEARYSNTKESKSYDFTLWNQYSSTRDSLQSAGTRLFHQALDDIANELGFNTFTPSYREDMPNILIADPKFYATQLSNCTYDAPHRHIPPTYFAARGHGKLYGQEPGPVIQIQLEHLKPAVILEECLHYFQWFYNSDPILRNIRAERVQEYMESCEPENYGNLYVRKNEKSGLFTAKIVPHSSNEKFLSHMLYEATAATYQTYLGFVDSNKWYVVCENLDARHGKDSITGIPAEKKPSELANTLRDDGAEAFLEKLFKWNEVSSVHELQNGHHFVTMLTGSPVMTTIAHAFAEPIGCAAGEKLRETGNITTLTNNLFSRRGASERFDTLRAYL